MLLICEFYRISYSENPDISFRIFQKVMIKIKIKYFIIESQGYIVTEEKK